MIHKFRMFLLSAVTLTVLTACDPSSDNSLSVDSIADSVEEQVSEDGSNTSENSIKITSNNSEAVSSDAGVADVDPEELALIEEKEAEAAGIEEPKILEISEIQKLALQVLIDKTHLDKEGYSYSFQNTNAKDFIEIEVRESVDAEDEHMTREGTYRYVFATDEILVQDYLTGDFIPYEQ